MDNRVALVGVQPPGHRNSTRRLSGNDDLLGGASEGRNVLLDPFNGHPLVAQTEVGVRARGSGESKNIDAVIDSDNDNVFRVGRVLSAGERRVGVTSSEAYEW